MIQEPLPPIAMLAELTHRCPLQCPYCSNPLELMKANREMDTASWLDLFDQAADMGVLQVHLSGGEPTLRRDLSDIVAKLSARGMYSNLITAGVGIAEGMIEALADAGLDHVQLSLQGARAQTAELISRYNGAFDRKLETARRVRAAGLPLTINAPVHRHNIGEVEDYIELALALGAERLEIANVQYSGWALLNRAALMPGRAAVEREIEIVEAARERLRGILNIDFVPPDYFATFPKPCMGGWARDAFAVAPDGSILPCHAAQTIPSLTFDRFGERSLQDIWTNSAALNAFRGTDWMKEPCRTCDRREVDWGGCRCQAMAMTGDPAAADPVCIKSPFRELVLAAAEDAGGPDAGSEPFRYRRIGGADAA